MTDLRSNFLVRLERELKRQKLSRKAFADLMGVNRSYVTLLFNGPSEPTFVTVERVASTLDINPYRLLGPEKSSAIAKLAS